MHIYIYMYDIYGYIFNSLYIYIYFCVYVCDVCIHVVQFLKVYISKQASNHSSVHIEKFVCCLPSFWEISVMHSISKYFQVAPDSRALWEELGLLVALVILAPLEPLASLGPRANLATPVAPDLMVAQGPLVPLETPEVLDYLEEQAPLEALEILVGTPVSTHQQNARHFAANIFKYISWKKGSAFCFRFKWGLSLGVQLIISH